jgi:plastocyanin
MIRTRFLVLAGLVAIGTAGHAQTTVPAAVTTAPHLIVIKLIQVPGKMPYAFEPSNFTASPGDTLRFVEAADAMHNVHFKTMPKGAKLGGAATSPYLTALGQSYTIVVDKRFTDGKYELVCDPHDAVGMHAFLTVTGASGPAGTTK